MCVYQEPQLSYIHAYSEVDDSKAVWGDVDEKAHILQKILLVCFLSQVSYLVKHPYLGIKPHGNNHNDVLPIIIRSGSLWHTASGKHIKSST